MCRPWMRTLLKATCCVAFLNAQAYGSADSGFVRIEAAPSSQVRVLFLGAQIRPGLILTCAHCCRNAGGLGVRVRLHVLEDQTLRPYRTVWGRVACYDLDSDIGLVRLDDPDAIFKAYALAPRGTDVRPGDGVVAYRWRGAPEHLLSVMGQVTRANPFLGPPTLETNTPPQSGESGAPLVLASSLEIVGVTSAVDPGSQRGIYGGLDAIYRLLDQCAPNTPQRIGDHSVGRIIRIGHGAARSTASATVPISRCARPVRPCVAITIRSTVCSCA